MGAYSNDPDAARRRTLDRRRLPLLTAVVMGGMLALRLSGSADDQAARQLAGLGAYDQAADAVARSLRWMPISDYSLYSHEIAWQRAKNLLCHSCDATVIERVRLAIAIEGDFEKASHILATSGPSLREHSGYRYWVSGSRTLNGMRKFNLGQVSAADLEFRRALEAVPFGAAAWYGRAMVQNRLGDHDRAAHYLENALRI